MTMDARQVFPDRLRGLALLGIVVVNAPFLGISAEGLTGASLAGPVNVSVAFAVTVFAQAKFYLLFSFLFGYSSQFILRDGGAPDRRRFRRRLVALAAIGLIHATFFFVGDILMTYAVLGFGLLLLQSRSGRTVVWWAVASAAVSITLALSAAVVIVVEPTIVTDDPALLSLDEALATGGFLQAAVARLSALPTILIFTFVLQGTMAFGAFCLGMLAGRVRLLADAGSQIARWRRWALLGIAVGLPVQIIAAWLEISGLTAGEAARATVGVLLGFVAAPLLSLGYLGCLGLALARFPGFAKFADVPGRVALSIYVGESVLLSLVFCSYGLGLFGQWGAAAVIGVGVLAWALLTVAAHAWLRRYRQGPLEAVVARWAGRSRAAM